MKLSERHCVPCEGIGQALNPKQAADLLKSTENWNLDAPAKKIVREIKMKNFMAAVRLIDDIARVAEEENHHPDFHLTGYRNLRVELSTHALNGLSENDFILAAKINGLPMELRT